MIAKTRHKRAKAKFDYPKVKARIKRQYRERFKQKISLSEIDEIWKAWLELVLVPKLLAGRKVEIINGFNLEVVGRRIEDMPAVDRLFKNGLTVYANGRVKDGGNLNPMKRGFVYKIECNNSHFKNGKLYFKADAKIRKQLHYLLSNTGQYFRIETK